MCAGLEVGVRSHVPGKTENPSWMKPEMRRADSTCQGEIGKEKLRGKGLFGVLFCRPFVRRSGEEVWKLLDGRCESGNNGPYP